MMSKELEVKKETGSMLQIDEGAIKEIKHQYDLFRKLQKEVLEENVDYGFPIKQHSESQKPSLYKSGAEKLVRLFNLTPEFEIIKEIENESFIMYKFVCRLKAQDGKIIGVGYGACNSKEKRGWDQNPWVFQNSILKIAKKRSLVDAVLTGLGASNVFTQDLEDMEIAEEHPKQPGKTQQQNTYYIVKDMAEKQLYKEKTDLWQLMKKRAKELHLEPEDILNDVKEKFDLNTLSGIRTAKNYVEAYKPYEEENVIEYDAVKNIKDNLFAEIDEELSDAPF
jgi:hypothetical protein